MKVTIQDSRTSVTVEPRDFRVTVSGARGPQGPQGPAGEAGASEWGDIGGTLSEQTDLQTALDSKVDENAAITGATKTKITYDSKGLVTAGADAAIADISGLQTALDGKVPYTGATQDVNLGEFGLLTGNVEFDTTPTNAPTAAGSMYYDNTSGTVVNILKGGNVISKIGETQHVRVYNNTGSPIAKGKVVAINGAQGQRPTIILADADSETLSKDTIGFTAEAIADGAEGFVMIAGMLTNISTSGMADGDTVYLSTTAGSYTNVKPEAPVHMVILGFVVNGGSGGAGQIYVKVDNGYELEELHNVKETAKTTAVDADALLLQDSADSNLWKPFSWLNAKAGVKSHMDTFKSVANGYASLDGSGKVPASELPSYVDDVVEVANYAALPGTGETGKIYVTLDNNKCYRWSGSVYIQVAQGVDTLTTTGTSGAATLVGSTLNIPQYQGVLTNPVTGTGTVGQVAYWNGATTLSGESNLFYDATNDRLGVGISSPTTTLDVNGNINTSGNVVINSPNVRYFGIIGTPAGGWARAYRFLGSAGTLYGGVWGIGNIDLVNYYTLGPAYDNGLIIQQNGNGSIGTASSISNTKFTVRGSGTTSATTALLVQNSTPSELFRVHDNGWTQYGTGQGVLVFPFSDTTGGTPNLGGGNLHFYSYNRTSTSKGRYHFGGNSFNATAGANANINSEIVFIPTSGTATYTDFLITATINQTGGANGITRGLYVNPTLTAAADWRSIETSNNTGYAAYFAGSADLFLGNGTDIQLGTTTGTKIGTATTQKIGLWNATPIVQPTTAIAEAAFVENSGGTAVNVDSTFAGYTIQQIAQALKDIGIIA